MCGLFIESLLRIFPIQWKGRGPKRAENAHVARTKEVVFLRSSDANEIIIGLRGSRRSLRNCVLVIVKYYLRRLRSGYSFRGVLRIVDFIVLVLPCDHILRSSTLQFYSLFDESFSLLFEIRSTF